MIRRNHRVHKSTINSHEPRTQNIKIIKYKFLPNKNFSHILLFLPSNIDSIYLILYFKSYFLHKMYSLCPVN